MDGILTSFTDVTNCNCYVHDGFQRAASSVWESLYQEVQRLLLENPLYRVKVTGHSLGAALAQITGLRLSYEGINVQMINFGAPKIGD